MWKKRRSWMPSCQWRFADFRLDLDNASLWRGTQPLTLTPKAFGVLQYLVTHADRLVTKDTLLDAVWPETAISDAVVRIAIGEVRRVLGDTAQAPRFIATVHRRGYRFLAPVTRVRPPPVPRPRLSRRGPRSLTSSLLLSGPWSGARRCSPVCTRYGRRHARGNARCCSSPANRGSARPPLWRPLRRKPARPLQC